MFNHIEAWLEKRKSVMHSESERLWPDQSAPQRISLKCKIIVKSNLQSLSLKYLTNDNPHSLDWHKIVNKL